MHLSEIFNAEISDRRWSDIINSIIEKHGLETFSGMHATVVTTPDREHVYRMWTVDPGYERWLDLAMTMQDDPHIVKIFGKPRVIRTKFKGMPNDVKVKFVKLEKLTPMKHSSVAQRAFNIVTNSMDDDAPISAEDYPAHTPPQKFIKDNRSFFNTCIKINKKIRMNDLNDDNVMMRGDTMVLVDPIS